ncbi:lactonase family protein [Pelagicoccus mobilis]|uniref:Lactonase family protein n=1 Tax=Pelagicoccus mobilis TaxID=415221 RepID=A0A934RXE8_9BACT|nr:lactonase family protein [Pelagicoccus mobilis]MBK1876571.1 lactonase family protein [Pelagicoccus mobilis]
MNTLKKSLLFVACSLGLSCVSAETIWIAAEGGVYRSELNEKTGALSEPKLSCEFPSGSFLAIHPELDVMYATYRTREQSGYMSLVPTGDGKGLEQQSLQLLAKKEGSPSHLMVSDNGKWLAGAHWGGKTNFVFQLEKDGSVSEKRRGLPQEGSGPGNSQNQSRPHWICFANDDSFIHSVDLGSDEIWTYSMNGSLDSIELSHKVKFPLGTGPRHMAFHPSFEYAYVTGELNLYVNSLHYDRATGRFSPIQFIPTVESPEVRTTLSEIQVHPNGKFVYAGVRGSDLIAAYSIDQSTGELTMVEGQETQAHWPRNFTVSDSGNWLIVGGQNSNEIRVFSIDLESGALELTDSRIELKNPVCIRAWGRL